MGQPLVHEMNILRSDFEQALKEMFALSWFNEGDSFAEEVLQEIEALSSKVF